VINYVQMPSLRDPPIGQTPERRAMWSAKSGMLEGMREMFATWLNTIAIFAAGFAFGLWMPKGEKKPC
jgi:hypothetical protein